MRFDRLACAFAYLLCLAAPDTESRRRSAKPVYPAAGSSGAGGAGMRPAAAPRRQPSYGQLPVRFEVNRGQADPRVRFLCRGAGYALLLTSSEAVLVVQPAPRPRRDTAAHDRSPTAAMSSSREAAATPVLVRMKLAGANPKPEVVGLDELPGKSHYFLGDDPRQWQTHVSSYARVQYREVYPGIDLVYYGKEGKLEYDLVVGPGANPDRIQLEFEGANGVGLRDGGALVLRVPGGEVHQRPPVVYQEVNGRRNLVASRYVLHGNRRVGFAVAEYDRSRPLRIDPVLVYSTFLGGEDRDVGRAIAVDPAGNAYIAGTTISLSFPATPNVFQRSWSLADDAFVAKLDASGGLVYATYLGGRGSDGAQALAVDSSGNVSVTGSTESTDFPTASPFQGTRAGTSDAFVTKLNSNGSVLLYSTYLGGSSSEFAYSIAVDAADTIVVAGQTFSSNFPTASAFQPTFAGSGGGGDAFVTRISAGGKTLAYSTYLGGTGGEIASGVALDGAGNAYVTGRTSSTNFPTANPLRSTYAGEGDAFVAKLSASGSSLVYSTFLGGGGDDAGNGIAVDAAGSAYVAGETASADFPTASPAQSARSGGIDAFVAKLDATGGSLVYSTYLGGTLSDFGYGIAVDAAGNAYVTGQTRSLSFPTLNAFQASPGDFYDAFVAKLVAAGALAYSSYLGGESDDYGYGIALDTQGSAYVVGTTFSNDFPRVNPYQTVYSGTRDAFVSKISDSDGTTMPYYLLYPRLVTSDATAGALDTSEYTGIALVNSGATGATVRLTAYDRSGSPVAGTNVKNPVEMDLAAGKQFALVDYQLFGAGLPSEKRVGWIKIESTARKLVGFFLMFNGSLGYLDGADVSSRSLTSFVLPENEDLGVTEVHVVNPDSAATDLTFDLLRSDGTARTAPARRSIPAGGVLAEPLADVFPGVSAAASDYLRATSSRGVVPFVSLKRPGIYVAGLNGQDASAGAATLYSPQYVVGGSPAPYRTTLSVVNLESTPAEVTLRFIRDDGTQAGATQARTLAPKGKLHVTDQRFFLDAGSTLTQGYITISSNGPKLAGSVVFGDPARSAFSSALPLVAALPRLAVFSQVASNATYFTGLAILNPWFSTEIVVIEVRDENGNVVGRRTESIPQRQRKSQLLTQWFPALLGVDRSSGYIRITSNRGVASFVLFGTNDLQVLSAVPAQAAP